MGDVPETKTDITTTDNQTNRNPDSPAVAFLKSLKWYYATRALGTIMVLYGMFGDKTPERATLILTGAGFLGFDFVKRNESEKK